MTVWSIALLGACIGLGTGVLGAGASILTVLLFVHVAQLPMENAVATSLVVVAVTSVVALVPYSRAGHVVWKAGAAFSAASTAGAFVGGRLSARLPATALLVLFALATTAAALAMLFRHPSPERERTSASAKSLLAMGAAGLPIGGLTGLVGLGGGFAVLPVLVLCAGTPVRAAVGTTLFVVVLNTLAGIAGHMPHASIDWPLASYVAAVASAGSLAGARLAPRIDTHVVRRAFAVLLLAVSIALIGRAFLR